MERTAGGRAGKAPPPGRRTSPFDPLLWPCPAGVVKPEGGPTKRISRLFLDEAAQLLAPARVAELAERLGLDLTDALAGDVEVLPDLLEGVLVLGPDAEALPQDLLLPGAQRLEHPVGGLLEAEADDGVLRRFGLL